MSKKTSLLILSILSMPMAANAVNPYYICQPCGKGQYEKDGKCTACPKGQYQDAIAQSSCKPCPAGQYQDAIAQTLCKSCPAGQYQDWTGQTGCKQCPEGAAGCDPKTGVATSCKTSYLYKDKLTEMVNADRRYVLEGQGYTCTSYIFWYSCTKQITPYCEKCPAGYYCPDQNTQRICPLGHRCPGGNVQPIRCGLNYCADNLGSTKCKGPIMTNDYTQSLWYGWGIWSNYKFTTNILPRLGVPYRCSHSGSEALFPRDPASGKHKDCDVYRSNGTHFHFCSEGDRIVFLTNPYTCDDFIAGSFDNVIMFSDHYWELVSEESYNNVFKNRTLDYLLAPEDVAYLKKRNGGMYDLCNSLFQQDWFPFSEELRGCILTTSQLTFAKWNKEY